MNTFAGTLTVFKRGSLSARFSQNRFPLIEHHYFRPWLVAVAAIAVSAASARANLNIVATYDPSIATNGSSAAIETAVNAALTILDNDVLNNVTVNIDFGLETDPRYLGTSLTTFSNVTYSSYLTALQTKQTLSANDNTAIASLSAGPNNPVNNTGTIVTTAPLLRALGYSAPATQAGISPTNITFDSDITLNLAGENLTRPGVTNNDDFESTVEHEVNEVLGIGGAGSAIATNAGALTGGVGPMDLYRYSAAGTRSFTASTNAISYFSINGGTNKLVNFNQGFGGESDYGDWGDGVSPADGKGNSPALVQDAFGTPGSSPDDGVYELTALDVVGWNVVPEPSTMALVGLGTVGAYALRRRRRKS
ncbi:MAG TPA: NF038122 family metalloprotease [Verrucomicrobiae bacterium]|nr:NF038122 family metalloprotease [Verrucomicrobiae bacterium]